MQCLSLYGLLSYTAVLNPKLTNLYTYLHEVLRDINNVT